MVYTVKGGSSHSDILHIGICVCTSASAPWACHNFVSSRGTLALTSKHGSCLWVGCIPVRWHHTLQLDYPMATGHLSDSGHCSCVPREQQACTLGEPSVTSLNWTFPCGSFKSLEDRRPRSGYFLPLVFATTFIALSPSATQGHFRYLCHFSREGTVVRFGLWSGRSFCVSWFSALQLLSFP